MIDYDLEANKTFSPQVALGHCVTKATENKQEHPGVNEISKVSKTDFRTGFFSTIEFSFFHFKIYFTF